MQQENLQTTLEAISKEKKIAMPILVETLEQAILTAAKRTFGVEREFETKFTYDEDAKLSYVHLELLINIVEEVEEPGREISVVDAKRYNILPEDFEFEPGIEMKFPIWYHEKFEARAKEQEKKFGDLLGIKQHRRGFGRIAVQMAKQVIIQRVRDAERDNVFNQFKEKIGELITGTVSRFERGNQVIVHLENGRDQAPVEAVLPQREQAPREHYRPGDKILAILKNIDRDARGPQLILSRAEPALLVKLFEMEVPEIYEGIVKVVSASREPGARSKIAVMSRDNDVDPVGACVGMKGARVQNVVQELRGEKIDIVPWEKDPARFVCNAIAPAEISKVVIDESNHTMELVVPDAKLSLAIGRRGQNVRLASQLTGWKIDIISDSQFKQLEEQSIAAFQVLPSLNETLAKNLYRSGFRNLTELSDAEADELMAIDGFGDETFVTKVKNEAQENKDKVVMQDFTAKLDDEDTFAQPASV